jgi:hypothetical protein
VTQTTNNRVLTFVLAMFSLASLLLFLIPAYVIRPFRYQSPQALTLAIAVKRIAPSLTLILSIVVLLLGVRLWRRSAVAVRILTALALLVSLGSAVMVRQNYFEWMFHPITTAGFVSVDKAQLPDREMLMTVQIGSDARAYPIARMAYHHILNDTVGKEPIVVTY